MRTYTQDFDDIGSRKDISCAAKRLYARLARLQMKAPGKPVQIGIRALAELLGTTRSSVYLAGQRLKSVGMVDYTEWAGRKARLWTLLSPDDVASRIEDTTDPLASENQDATKPVVSRIDEACVPDSTTLRPGSGVLRDRDIQETNNKDLLVGEIPNDNGQILTALADHDIDARSFDLAKYPDITAAVVAELGAGKTITGGLLVQKLRTRQTHLANTRSAEESKRQRQQTWTDGLAKQASSDHAHYADRINGFFDTLDAKDCENLDVDVSGFILKEGGQIAIAWWKSQSTREERRAIAARAHLERDLRRFPDDLPVLGAAEEAKIVQANDGLFAAPGVLAE